MLTGVIDLHSLVESKTRLNAALPRNGRLSPTAPFLNNFRMAD
jgi:hypothetical protein